MNTQNVVETLCHEGMEFDCVLENPIIQEMIESSDLEAEVKLPYMIPNKILMSPGIWNEFYYDGKVITTAYRESDWEDKEVRALFLDHKDELAKEWVGEVRNIRLEGQAILGDLWVVDKPTAMKLAFGAKFGISPRVQGNAAGKVMESFIFDNFSVVINPAVKTAYINNKEETTMVDEKPEEKKEETSEETADTAQESPEETTKVEPTEEDKKEEEVKPEEVPAEKAEMTDIDTELSEFTDFAKEYRKKNPEATLEEIQEAWKAKKNEMSDLKDTVQKMSDKMEKLEQELSERPKPAVSKAGGAEDKTIQELTEKVKSNLYENAASYMRLKGGY